MADRPTIYFIRHGETDWNRDRRYQGQRDIPLNDKGRAQAHRNGVLLRDFLPRIANAAYLASPLSRARETMEIVRGALGLPAGGYAIDERLVELSYGMWEGQLQDDIRARDPESFAARSKDTFRWRPEHGESYQDLLSRVSTWWSEARGDCVVVAHGGVSRCLRVLCLGLEPSLIPELDSPQDLVLVLEGGTMRWL